MQLVKFILSVVGILAVVFIIVEYGDEIRFSGLSPKRFLQSIGLIKKDSSYREIYSKNKRATKEKRQAKAYAKFIEDIVLKEENKITIYFKEKKDFYLIKEVSEEISTRFNLNVEFINRECEEEFAVTFTEREGV